MPHSLFGLGGYGPRVADDFTLLASASSGCWNGCMDIVRTMAAGTLVQHVRALVTAVVKDSGNTQL